MSLIKTTLESNFISDKYKYIMLFLVILLQGAITSPLEASMIYSTSILESKENDSVFLEAINSNNLDAARSLISSGYDVNETSKNGYTPLMGAVYKGNVEMIKLLISAGAKLEDFDNQGNTPFMYAFFGTEEKKLL